MDAVLKPKALGLNVIWNVVLPTPTIELAGDAVTVKSPAFAPVIDTPLGIFKVPDVKFWIVNVLAWVPATTSTLPKSVIIGQ